MGNRQALLEEEEVENILVRKHFKGEKNNLVRPVLTLVKRDGMLNILTRSHIFADQSQSQIKSPSHFICDTLVLRPRQQG